MAKRSKGDKKKVYEVVADVIMERMDAEGLAPWQKPWVGGVPTSLGSGKAYRGINAFLLSCSAYSSPYWLTYAEAERQGGNVRKGERSMPAIFFKMWDRKDEKTGEMVKVPIARIFRLFNLEQCEGVEAPQSEIAPLEHNPIDACEAIVSSYPAPPRRDASGAACYSPLIDTVFMPDASLFRSSEDYYSVLFHELAHSTGHHTRLAREGVTNHARFGSHTYGEEELVAEFTTAYLCAVAGIAPKVQENQAAYLNSWRRTIRAKPEIVLKAAQAAQKAADYIQGLHSSE